jgi:hypothetical protein
MHETSDILGAMSNKHFFVVAVLTVMFSLSGCAERHAEALAKLPVAGPVCIRTSGVQEPEQGLVARKSTLFLKERGFQPATENCDIVIQYTALDENKWELATTGFLGRSRSSYRVEGIVTISRGEKPIAVDVPVNLRDYSSKSDLLDALAWELASHAIDNYRPSASLAP